MKKLMIAAAVVIAAVVSHAAALDWKQNTYGGIKWQDGGSAGGKTAYLIQFATTDADTAASLSLALYNAIASGSTKISDVIGGSLDDGVIKNSGFDVGKVEGTAEHATKLVNQQEAYYALFCTTSVDGDDWFLMSDVESGIAYDPLDPDSEGSSATFSGSDFDFSETGIRNGWTMAAVPEPTSGLLLLLGVAGLALRRRRA